MYCMSTLGMSIGGQFPCVHCVAVTICCHAISNVVLENNIILYEIGRFNELKWVLVFYNCTGA